MNGKRIQGRGVLLILLVLCLTALYWGLLGCGGKEGETTQSTVAGATELSGTESSVGGGQPTTSQSLGEQTTAQAGSSTTAVPSAGDLSSYRIHTVWRDGSDQGAIKDEWTTEFVADPLAVHHKAGGDMAMEIIFVGKTLWTKILDQPWRQMDLPEGQTADWASLLSQAQSQVDVEEQTPLDSSVQWLMGQPAIKIAEGSLTPAGEESVNGVACKRYNVDSTYGYTVKYEAPLSGSATITEGAQGDIWVADQGGWAPFVVRAQLLQTTTTKVDGGGSSAETVYVDQNVSDVNASDIVVEPPK
jgi:hypothetical protein